ncbi:hypothetical protein ACOSQ2_019719 [Xanthoceras sorbifolium]
MFSPFIFGFHFNNLLERKHVLVRGPSTFDGSLLVLEEQKDVGKLSLMKFKYVKFWLQIYNVSLMCMTRDIGLFLSKQINIMRDIDVGALRDYIGKYIRVRVGVEIDKPLKRYLKTNIGEPNNVVVMLLRYKRLLEYFFWCGFVGHSFLECLHESNQTMEERSKQFRFEAWMRA